MVWQSGHSHFYLIAHFKRIKADCWQKLGHQIISTHVRLSLGIGRKQHDTIATVYADDKYNTIDKILHC